MRIIEERTFKIKVVAPEDQEKDQVNRRIIEEVESEDKKFNPSEWHRDTETYGES